MSCFSGTLLGSHSSKLFPSLKKPSILRSIVQSLTIYICLFAVPLLSKGIQLVLITCESIELSSLYWTPCAFIILLLFTRLAPFMFPRPKFILQCSVNGQFTPSLMEGFPSVFHLVMYDLKVWPILYSYLLFIYFLFKLTNHLCFWMCLTTSSCADIVLPMPHSFGSPSSMTSDYPLVLSSKLGYSQWPRLF